MELVLEQTQQGSSYEVSVSVEGVEELKRKVKIKGEKKEALLTLRQKPDSYKDGHGGTCDEVSKLKNFKKDDYTSFQDQEKYEHVGPKVTSTQDGKRSQDDDKRLYSADDLKKLKDHMQVKLKGTSLSLKSKDHYAYHKLKDKIQDHEQRPKIFVEC
ncbi:hypothetical protein Tco_0698748 [Tanacetum coccineum]